VGGQHPKRKEKGVCFIVDWPVVGVWFWVEYRGLW